MKVLGKFLTIVLLISFLAACGTQAQPPEATKAPVPELTAAEEWAKANGVGPYTPATDDWAAIEAAAIKEGSVVVYSNSSKIEKLLEPWNALYPNVKLEGGDTDDIAVQMSAEQQAGNVVGDVWFNSDGHLLYGEFVPNQWMWWYTPPGVVIDDVSAEQPFAMARRSVDVIGYNSEIFPDGCPATNDVVRATIYGGLVVAAIQGTLGGILFLALGLPSPLLWGAVMAFMSLVPVVGAAVVWVPAAALLFLRADLRHSPR